MIYIAFKTKPTDIIEHIISFVTRSKIIHCELVTELYKDRFLGYTSQAGVGVYKHWEHYDPNMWEFIALEERPSKVYEFFYKTCGKGYDYLGCLGFVFGNRDDPKKYFCSEWCAECLGLENPSSLTPKDLYLYFKDIESKRTI